MHSDETLVHVLCQRAAELQDKVYCRFLVDGDNVVEELTYRDLDLAAKRIACALRERTSAGERVLLLFPPGLEYIRALFGCLYAGLIPVPAYPPEPNRLERTVPRLRALVVDADCKIALTTRALLEMSPFIVAMAPELNTLTFIATDAIGEGTIAPLLPQSTDVCFMQYTSGSTGSPKGVVLTFAALASNAQMIKSALKMDETSDLVSWLPIYHDMGLIGMLFEPLWVGSTVTLMSPIHFVQKPVRWLRAIQKYRADVSGAPNFAFDLCSRRIKQEDVATLDLSSWRVAYCGAERIRLSTVQAFEKKFAVAGFQLRAFTPLYGLAEASLLVTGAHGADLLTECIDAAELSSTKCAVAVSDPESPNVAMVGCGPSAPGIAVRIVGENGEIRRDGEVGEIWVHGKNVASGYWNQPERSEAVFSAKLKNGEGPFMRTGDLGYIRNGQLFVSGRLKDIIILRGKNFYPDDIEQVADRAHPAVRPGCCAVFSAEQNDVETLVVVAELERRRPDLDGQFERRVAPEPHLNDPGEVPVDMEAAAMAIRQAISENFQILANDVILVRAGTIAKTSSGKIQRFAVKNEFMSKTLHTLFAIGSEV